MTTRFEQIAAAFPLHAQRIAECVYEQKGDRVFDAFMWDHLVFMDASLIWLFQWDKTTEGADYWCALYDERGFIACS